MKPNPKPKPILFGLKQISKGRWPCMKGTRVKQTIPEQVMAMWGTPLKESTK